MLLLFFFSFLPKPTSIYECLIAQKVKQRLRKNQLIGSAMISALSYTHAPHRGTFFLPPPSHGGAVAQLVERTTPGEEVPGSIPAMAARSLLVGSVSV